MECEEAGPLQQAVVAWLEGYASQLQQPGCLLLEVDVLDLAAGQQHPEIVAALVENPGACPARAHCSLHSLTCWPRHAAGSSQHSVPCPCALPLLPAEHLRQAVAAALSAAGLLTGKQRVWLRPHQLIAAAELSVPEALECMRAAPGALFSCHGVCLAATAPFQQPASRAFQCGCCGKACTVHGPQAPPACCGGPPPQEVEQARVMVQVRCCCCLCCCLCCCRCRCRDHRCFVGAAPVDLLAAFGNSSAAPTPSSICLWCRPN